MTSRPASPSPNASGTVASLHIHPAKSGEPLLSVDLLHLVAGKGIEEDRRYFGRVSRRTQQPSRRQVTLMEREQILEHATTLGLPGILPGVVRANIETMGIELRTFLGRKVALGESILYFYEARVPCQKMDAICAGLRALMEDGRQGILAEVIQSGTVKLGDMIRGAD